jgi:hypothetical protein
MDKLHEKTRKRYEIFTATVMKMAVSCVVAPCSLVKVYRRFRVALMWRQAPMKRRYTPTRLHVATTQKAASHLRKTKHFEGREEYSTFI